LPETDQFLSWFAKMNNSFKLPKNFTFQLSGEYQSKTVLPQVDQVAVVVVAV
jgi:hypothetical protein